jgi:sugar lactone lactonase YvrE
MKRKVVGVLIIAAIMLVPSTALWTADFGVIKNPKPNAKENRYIPLEKVKTVDADLGNGEYLFSPTSIAAGKDGVFVYDILQAKIFKFDRNLDTVITSFGRKGRGPAEFGGTGKGYPVFIQMGRDGKLYANDVRMKKIIVFDTSGKYFGEIKNFASRLRNPLVDASGNLYVVSVKDKIINVLNQEKKALFTINNQERSFDYLFLKPGFTYLEIASKNLAGELFPAMMADSTFLLYFKSSARLIILKKNKITKEINLWPEDALSTYKKKLEKVVAKGKNMYISMFFNLFTDEDNPRTFFLQFGSNERRGMNTLYQYDISGNLLNAYFVKFDKSEPFTRFWAKWRDRIYAIEDDKLILYKEEKK